MSRFQKVTTAKIDPQVTPYLVDKSRQLDLMVELTDESVASRVGDATDSGTSVTTSDRNTWRSEMQTDQAPVVAAVRKSGGTVLSQMQDAYDGIHVHVPAGAVSTIAAMPDVAGIHLVPTYKPALTESVPYVGAPQAWTSSGGTGAGVKIAVIDTGIDYYHADFGGSGDPADYTYGLANENTTVPAYNHSNGKQAFPSAKIPVGWDFVGDTYDASSADPKINTPQPDPNPLDCDSHGTHTASTIAGFGEDANGNTYHGPYNQAAYSQDFKIGPGVAPNATLYIYKVFGCAGTTDVVTEAINQAVKDGADVISMSLGSDFGTSDTPDAIAADNASRAGVVVVASSGNAGDGAYMTGTPASSSRTISVAAIDSNATFPGATIGLNPVISAIDANNASLTNVSGKLDVLTTSVANDPNDGVAADGISLGCEAADYSGVAPGDIVVTERGTCARVLRAELGQAAGAAAVIMVNNATGLPPFEGTIPAQKPYPAVTIPFIGVDINDGPALLKANGTQPVTITSAGPLTNPTYKNLADFSSWGPRFGDSALKPDITAPGVSIVAAGMGSGNDVLVDSGTSMAAPHVAGIAALVIAAHPGWSVNDVKAAIMSTADDTSAKIVGYDPVGAGSGVAQAQLATTTAAIAVTNDHLDSLAFGYQPLDGAYSQRPELHDRQQGLQIDHLQPGGQLHRRLGRGEGQGRSFEGHGSGSPVAHRRRDALHVLLGGRGTADGRDVQRDGPGRRPDG